MSYDTLKLSSKMFLIKCFPKAITKDLEGYSFTTDLEIFKATLPANTTDSMLQCIAGWFPYVTDFSKEETVLMYDALFDHCANNKKEDSLNSVVKQSKFFLENNLDLLEKKETQAFVAKLSSAESIGKIKVLENANLNAIEKKEPQIAQFEKDLEANKGHYTTFFKFINDTLKNPNCSEELAFKMISVVEKYQPKIPEGQSKLKDFIDYQKGHVFEKIQTFLDNKEIDLFKKEQEGKKSFVEKVIEKQENPSNNKGPGFFG